MGEMNNDNGSGGQRGGNRWMGLTPYQQMLLLPPILFLGGTLAIPGVSSRISVAAGALVLALVVVGLFWPGAATSGGRPPRAGHDGDDGTTLN